MQTGLPSILSQRWRLDWRQVGVLYVREMRAALRERNIVINSLLIPLLLYPLLLWVSFNGLTYLQGQTEGFRSRILVSDWPEGHHQLRRTFEREDRLHLLPPSPLADPQASLAESTLDAWIEFPPATEPAAALPGNFQIRVTFDQSKERSVTARDRVQRLVDQYRETWLQREAEALGIAGTLWHPFSITTENVASDREIGGFILGLMLPLFFVVAVAVGCFYPAIDTTAGERERGTWETLMTTSANRHSVAAAKYLFVASLGMIAGLLNLTALTLTMKPIFAPLLETAGETVAFGIGFSAMPIIGLGALLLGGFLAAGMLLFTAFARTFKEGQAMITPFFLLTVLPVLLVQAPGLEFSPQLALVPVVNVVLMIRAALAGSASVPAIAVTALSSFLVIAFTVRCGAFVLQHEEVLLGSHHGFRAFLQTRVLRRTPPQPPPT